MVHVRGHWRAGRWVRAHTRRAPRAAAGGAGLLVVGLLVLGGFLWLGHSSPTGSPANTPWQSGGLTFTSVGSSDAMPCGEHSYGQVQQYLRTNPCRSLFRVLLEAHDDQNHQMLVALSWTQMPDPATTDALYQLAHRDGTGNIAELSRELPAYSGVKFTGKYYDSRVDGTTVVIAEATPQAGDPPDALLKQAATTALGFPRN